MRRCAAEPLERRALLTQVLANPSFSQGAQGWLVSGDFYAGTNLTEYRTANGYAAGGVSAAGVPKDFANGSISQQVTIPADATLADLRFWYSITSGEGTRTAFDKLLVQVTNTTSGTVQLAQYSNKNPTSGYVLSPAMSLLNYKGQTVRVQFTATNDNSLPTVFRIDDVSLEVRTAALPPPPPAVPALQSRPSANAKLYLDFDGDTTALWLNYSPGTTPAFDTDGDPLTFNSGELSTIREVWQRVAEKFSPFDLDVTTVDPGALLDKQAFRIVIGGKGLWYGDGTAGGVTQLQGFYNPSASNTGFVFADPSKFVRPQDIAEAVAHESGHGFGLVHQHSATAEYYSPGGERAPIMGTSYSSVRGLWWRTNEFPGQNSTQAVQDDLLVLSGSQNGFGYRADDYAAAATLGGAGTAGAPWSAAGVVETVADADAFTFTSPTGGRANFRVDVAPLGPMLDARLELRSGDGSTLLQFDDPSTSLGASLGNVSLAAGTYRLVVAGHGSYGDVGQYTLSGQYLNQAPTVDSFADAPDPVAAGGTVTLSAAASDLDGGAVVVHFYRESNGVAGLQTGSGGDVPLGDDASAPYSLSASTAGLSPGSYTYYATADDGSDVSGTPATLTNTVVAPATPPTATLVEAPDVTAGGAAAYFFKVTYADDTAVDFNSIMAGNDVVVTGPNGYAQLATLANLPWSSDPRTWTATYYVTAPGGSFDPSDGGAYAISLRANEVSDTAGNFAPAAALGGFTVSLTDTTPPVATLGNHPDVTAGGAANYFFTVNYTDDGGVDYQSLIAGNDVAVSGPGGYAALATIASLTHAGPTWTASYYVPAPGGSFDPADNGAYTISLRANEVSDTAGNFAPPTSLGGFAVNLGDTTPPTATLASHPDVTAPGASNYFFSVTYADDVAFAYQSLLSGNDVEVSGPGGYAALGTIASLTYSAGAWTASYYVPAPGGSFDAADDGAYTISLRAGEVSDAAGNFAPPASLGGFAVSIGPAATPAASAATPLFSDALIPPRRRLAPLRSDFETPPPQG